MRRIAVVTFGRSDWSSLLPVARAIESDSELELALLVSGTHLDPRFGGTERDVAGSGLPASESVELSPVEDSPLAVAVAVGEGCAGLAQAFVRIGPDLVLLVGDRIELLAAATAALPLRIPVAHVSGGDVTEGAIDEQVRHAVTKLSHLHFVAIEEHAERLRRLGEEDGRIHVTGDPALDTLASMSFLDRGALEGTLGVELLPPVALVTFHPTTLGEVPVETEVDELLAGLEGFPGTLVFTHPNADAGQAAVREQVERFAAATSAAHTFASLGQERYYSLLACADLLVGNSSSAIWEAPSFALPAVNVGDRQGGRVRAGNVLDVPAERERIAAAVRRALDPSFRAGLVGMLNPYGDGHAAPRIVSVLADVPLGPDLLRKRAP